VEIGGGACLLLGFATRFAAIPLIIDMIVAILTTKIPILMDQGFWGSLDARLAPAAGGAAAARAGRG
jgi:uncharacterized membrane protein YphA (DoxX/SURF4 family)